MLHTTANKRQASDEEGKRLKNNRQEWKLFVCDILKKGELRFYLIKKEHNNNGPTLRIEGARE